MTSRARLESIDAVAPDVLTLDARLVEPAAIRFRAGQFVTVLVPSQPRPLKRPYSIASSPERTDGFELLVKLVPGGIGSRWIRERRPGDEVDFLGPHGLFCALDRHPGDVVFAVTGSGIAAALPMATEVLGRRDEGGRVLLYWGMRRTEDLYWGDRLEALRASSPRLRASICLSQPGPVWAGAHGRIVGHVLEELPRLRDPTFYLVGNGEMIRELTHELVERGIDKRQRVRTEVFYRDHEP